MRKQLVIMFALGLAIKPLGAVIVSFYSMENLTVASAAHIPY